MQLPSDTISCETIATNAMSGYKNCYKSLFVKHNNAFINPFMSKEVILKRSADYVSIDMIKNVSILNSCRLQRLFHRIFHKSSAHGVEIVVLGGSLTAGRMVGGMDFAWPKVAETTLNEFMQKENLPSRVRFANRAELATTSVWALHRLKTLIPGSVDLVIVDYDVNDCADLEKHESSQQHLMSVTELLVRLLLNHKSAPAVVFLNVAVNHHEVPLTPTCDILHTCYAIGHIRRGILDSYGVPQISQKEAIWSNFTCPPPQHVWPCSRVCSHPLAKAHKLLAELVVSFLKAESLSLQPDWTRHLDSLGKPTQGDCV